jgi:hypothetical protein
MIMRSLLAVPLLWTFTAQAAPSVTVSGECGGWVTVDIALDADGDYRVIWGETGSETVPLGGCAGTEVGVSGPVTPLRTTTAGADSISFPTTAEHCSQSLQVIDMSSCAVSEVVSLTTLAEVGYASGFADGEASVECDLDAGYADGYAAGLEDCPLVEEAPECFMAGLCAFYGLEASYGHLELEEAEALSDLCRLRWVEGNGLLASMPLKFVPPSPFDQCEAG